MSKIVDGGILIVLLTAYLFALSIANFNAFLAEVGVATGFVLRDFHQVLYNSLFVILVPILTSVVWTPIVGGGVIALARAYVEGMKRWRVLRKAVARIRYKSRKIPCAPIEKEICRLLLRLVPACLVVMMLFFGLVKSEEMGTEDGAELLNKIKSKNHQAHEVISLKGYSSKVYVVACGLNNCAGINVDTMEVVYFENKFAIGDVSSAPKAGSSAAPHPPV